MSFAQEIRGKIASIKGTQKITRAMEMVASAGLRGAQQRIERFRPYADKFNSMLSDLAARTEGASHALLENRENKKNVLILLITSDRGLCGAFNVNLINAALKLAKEKESEGKAVSFICVGRKGRDAVRKTSYQILSAMTDVMGNLNFQVATQLGNTISHSYTEYTADEVYLVYSEFVSMSRQVAQSMPLLPIVPSSDGGEGAEIEYIYEPNVSVLLAELLPRYLNVQIYRGLLDNFASENAARMFAMNNATNNCDEMIGSLTLLFNKTRQAAITNDLMDIVGGANALQSQ